MNFKTKNANDLMSKDRNISKTAAGKVIENKDIETFKILCEKSDFIFDFIKEKIIQNLTDAVCFENLENLFDFTKIYNEDFGKFIVDSFVKFADEDLTDRMLEMFDKGTYEQKAYCALYFSKIQDPLSIEFLNKYAFSDYEPLNENCAFSLMKFNDRELYNKSVEIIQNKEIDDFEKYKYVNFLVSYGDKKALPVMFDYLQHTYTKEFIASSILYLTSFEELLCGDIDKKRIARKLFDIILSGYPEEISLETVLDFNIFNLVKNLSENILSDNEDSYTKRILLKAKYKFNLVSREDIYTFDLSKEAKKEILDINNFINTLNINLFNGIENELQSNDRERILETLDVILNFGKTEFIEKIAEIINKTEFEDVISEGIRVLGNFGKINIIDKNIAGNIKNKNLKAITLSYFE